MHCSPQAGCFKSRAWPKQSSSTGTEGYDVQGLCRPRSSCSCNSTSSSILAMEWMRSRWFLLNWYVCCACFRSLHTTSTCMHPCIQWLASMQVYCQYLYCVPSHQVSTVHQALITFSIGNLTSLKTHPHLCTLLYMHTNSCMLTCRCVSGHGVEYHSATVGNM